ncbi:Transgelin [Nakaseomyces bracarensis]|uniref:Transgelin n=1 Tax=Nakaseomyces bracarensis TaxID=273131 RepID=A0ABR4NTL0_9SACH
MQKVYGVQPDVTTLDDDLRQLRNNKFSEQAIEEIRTWVLGTILKDSDIDRSEPLLEVLKDGSILCQLANALGTNEPGFVPIKWKKSTMPFVQMEQISMFLSFARQYGVPEDELFQTVDLFEEKDPASVYQALKSLSRYANKKHPQQFPVLGPQISEKKPRPPVKAKPKHLQTDSPGWSTFEYGYMKGASQRSENVVFGQKRDIL